MVSRETHGKVTIIPVPEWSDAFEAPVVTLPCGHRLVVWWPIVEGRLGRVSCTAPNCRANFDDVCIEAGGGVLE